MPSGDTRTKRGPRSIRRGSRAVETTIFRNRSEKLLINRNKAFDPRSRRWEGSFRIDDECEAIEPLEALRWLQLHSGTPVRVPVGVIGTRIPDDTQSLLAENLGRGLAQLGLNVICGGKAGVMEAACRGVASVPGGLSIGLLPDGEPEAANSFVTVPIATGIGVARNILLAQASCCLVAVGGGHGTLSEIAFALQFGRPVLRVGNAPDVGGAIDCTDADAVIKGVVHAVLRL